MTELEKMQRAKMYVDKLANGFDPITNAELSNDTVLNNVRLMRCFFYISDVLRQVIENGGEVTKKGTKTANVPFRVTHEDILRIPISESPLPISRFCDAINSAVCTDNMKKLKYKLILDWLIEREYIAEEEIRGSKKKRAGKNASEIGIFEEARVGYNGEYIALLYGPDAQRFILGNLITILECDAKE